MPSHLSYEQAVNKGYTPEQWTTNWFADQLATKAASEAQVPDATAQYLGNRTSQTVQLLRYLVQTVVSLAPAGPRSLQIVKS